MPVCRRLAPALLVFLAASAAAPGQTAPAPLLQDPRVASAVELARTWLEAQRAYDQIPGVSAAIVRRSAGALGAAASGRRIVADGRAGDRRHDLQHLFDLEAVHQRRSPAAARRR